MSSDFFNWNTKTIRMNKSKIKKEAQKEERKKLSQTKMIRELLKKEREYFELKATPMTVYDHFLNALQHIIAMGIVLFTWFPVLIFPKSSLCYSGGMIFSFILIPVMDFLLGKDSNNPTSFQQKQMEDIWFYKIFLYLYPLIQTIYLSWSMIHWTMNVDEMTLLMKICFIASVGTAVGGIGVNISHELFHKVTSRTKRYIGIFLLFQSSYAHFSLAHMSHHRKVGTKMDPATARYGESLYRFIPRSWFYGFHEAWDSEAYRLTNLNLPLFSYHNRFFWLMIGQIITWICTYYIFGYQGFVFFLAQSAMSQFLIETVNYVEHYGLQRDPEEPVNILHSWNASDRFSNWILFKLERHSDHHANPLKSYQSLCSYSVSPTLISGYPTMILLALCPPLYFKLMNPLCDKYNAVDIKDLERIMINERLLQNQPPFLKRGIATISLMANDISKNTVVIAGNVYHEVMVRGKDAHGQLLEYQNQLSTLAGNVYNKGKTFMNQTKME